MAIKRRSDMSAAFTGLILGGSVLFLLLLTIVWLTNRHFEGKKAAESHEAAPVAAAAQPAPGTAAGVPVPPPPPAPPPPPLPGAH